MPLLPLEPVVFPDDLLGSLPADGTAAARWWVLHTRPRAEKSLARRCLRRRLPFFLPLHQKQWRKGGRLFSSHVPLFPGYFFLYGDGEARMHALETKLVANWLPVDDQERLHNDLCRVHHLITVGAPLTPEDRLMPGARVEITHGPFAGLEGVVLRRGKQLRIFVAVQFLQQGVSVEIETWMLRPLAS